MLTYSQIAHKPTISYLLANVKKNKVVGYYSSQPGQNLREQGNDFRACDAPDANQLKQVKQSQCHL